MITKEKFNRYVKLQQSGKVNMFDMKAVTEETKLTADEYFDIIKNYEKYKLGGF